MRWVLPEGSLEEDVRNPDRRGVSRHVDVHRHQLVVEGEVIQLLTVAPPPHVAPGRRVVGEHVKVLGRT